MTNEMVDTTPAGMGRAVITNLLDYLLLMRRSFFAERLDTPVFSRWQTRIPHPWYNGLMVTQPPDDSAPQVIRDALAYYQSREVGVFTWWCRPPLDPSAWEPVLAPFGFRRDDATPGMAVDLRHLDYDRKNPAGLEIRVVDDLRMLSDWVRTFLLGYELPSTWEGDFYHLLSGLPLDWPLRYYLGYRDGRPVATSNTFLSDGVVGVYCVATLPEARGQGVGAALTLVSLADAEQQGGRLGILQSSRMGYGVYQRIGFQHVCQVTHFACGTNREPHE